MFQQTINRPFRVAVAQTRGRSSCSCCFLSIHQRPRINPSRRSRRIASSHHNIFSQHSVFVYLCQPRGRQSNAQGAEQQHEDDPTATNTESMKDPVTKKVLPDASRGQTLWYLASVGDADGLLNRVNETSEDVDQREPGTTRTPLWIAAAEGYARLVLNE